MRVTFILTVFLLTTPSWADNNTDPSGLWNTFDDNGNIESTVEVRIEEGKLYACLLYTSDAADE